MNIRWLKQEAVLCTAALCAAMSMTAIPPDSAYLSYMDWQVLGLLWALMAVVAGLRSCGVLEMLTQRLLQSSRNGRALSVVLVLLPFFTSMAVTNDVALLTFVPFTLALLHRAGCNRAAISMTVLQTLAANLGCMGTPVGSPQNLYLYSFYQLSPGPFFSTMLPLTALSLLCLTAAALPVLPKTMPEVKLDMVSQVQNQRAGGYLGLFLLCLLAVFRVFPWQIAVAAVLLISLVCDREILKKPDYALLATFVCFFIFSGNLSRIPAAHLLLQNLLDHSALLTALAASQVISNVPAAMLLAGFTDQWRELLLGVNIGAMGTPVASLASLISLKVYLQSEGACPGRYLAVFTLAGLAGIAILLAAVWTLV